MRVLRGLEWIETRENPENGLYSKKMKMVLEVSMNKNGKILPSSSLEGVDVIKISSQ